MDQPKKKLIHRLRYRYRLVLINDESFEEKLSLKLTPMNVFVALSTLLVTVITLTILLIFYTPFKEFVPGYTDSETKRNIKQLLYKTDSLTAALKAKETYYLNIINILNGGVGIKDSLVQPEKGKPTSLNNSRKNEKEFVKQFETKANKSTLSINKNPKGNWYKGLFFMTPAQGIVTQGFNPAEDHFAVDIAAKPSSAVKAAQEGTVILTGWTPQTGNTLAIQHKNNLVTIYKHNASILKKVGNFVEAGEVIALVGNTGELTSGPHLHFEIWENGRSVNPADLLNVN